MIKYIIKMSAPCECCEKESYGFIGPFNTRLEGEKWIMKYEISMDYNPRVLPLTIKDPMDNRILFSCENKTEDIIN